MILLGHSRLVLTFVCFFVPAIAIAGSENPPPGAPWLQDFGEAHREALKTGKPIFVYFTKTY